MRALPRGESPQHSPRPLALIRPRAVVASLHRAARCARAHQLNQHRRQRAAAKAVGVDPRAPRDELLPPHACFLSQPHLPLPALTERVGEAGERVAQRNPRVDVGRQMETRRRIAARPRPQGIGQVDEALLRGGCHPPQIEQGAPLPALVGNGLPIRSRPQLRSPRPSHECPPATL